MVDIKQEQPEPVAPVPPVQADSPQKIAAGTSQDASVDSAVEAADPRSKMSKGEKIYNWTVYSGINYWLNLAISIFSADFFISNKVFSKTPKGKMFGKTVSGPGMLNWGAEKMGGAVSKMGLASHEKSVHHAKTALKTSVLTSGGWLLLIPMKLMEDRKRPIVHWLNRMLGEKQTAPDGHKETPQEIYIEQEQPSQSWLRVLGRRTVAWLAVVGAGHVINFTFRDKKNSALYKGDDDKYGGKEVVGKFIVDNVNSNILESPYMPGGKWLRNNKTIQRYMEFGALDTLFTKITAVIMHKTNGAKSLHTKNEISVDCDPSNGDDIPYSNGHTLPAAGKHAAAVTPASRDALKPAASHVDMAKQAETNYTISP